MPLEGLPAHGAARMRLGRRLYYGCFTLAGLGAAGALLAAVGSQVAAPVLAAVPVLVAAAGMAFAAAVTAVVLSWWPTRG